MTILTIIGNEVGKTLIALLTTAIAAVIGRWVYLVFISNKEMLALVSNSNRKFVLYFRGETDISKTKTILFGKDGLIGGEKLNFNEYRWAVRRGLLEIHSKDRGLYSKFKWDKNSARLVHVNDPRLPSAMGQYIVPLFIPPDRTNTNDSKQ
jgi:hypothetical protein